jgi:hypothetical protein
MEIRPASGSSQPATQSSNVVFPAPEGPNRMVNPGAALKSTSSANSRSVEAKRLRMRARQRWICGCGCGVWFAVVDIEVFIRSGYGPGFLLRRSPVHSIYHGEDDEAED